MPGLRLIHFAAQKHLSRGFLHVAESAFWFMLALALGFGGRVVFSGLPVMAGYIFPFHMHEAAPAVAYHQSVIVDLPMTEAHLAAAASDPPPPPAAPVSAVPIPQKPAPRAHGPAIALVIDDMGPDVRRSRRAMHLPGNVALSFLPYGPQTPALAVAAERMGHDVLVHVPMQPLGHENPGPMALRPEMSAREITRRLRWDLDQVPGAIGINNHMGSRFTQDREGLIPVMRILMYRGLFYFDSLTVPHSVAMPLARDFGVLSASRDVFLDDVITPASVNHQLKVLEHVALTEGIALAIGHPHDVTLAALEKWFAHQQGFTLVPIREGLRMKTERDMGVPVAALRPASAR